MILLDKPKRPLSAYNIFFKHTRSRIVEGLSEECSIEEQIQSIESIVAKSTETRRHRKIHGQISFGDLARRIADNWKTISKDRRLLFDHYASLDMKRYRRDVAIWKTKKEQEALAAKMRVDAEGLERAGPIRGLKRGNSSHSSESCISDFSESMDNLANSISSNDDWAPRYRANDSLSSSFHSLNSELSMEPVSIADIEIVNQYSQLQTGHGNFSNNMSNHKSCVPSSIENSSTMQQNDNSSAAISTSSDMNEKKLQDIYLKNQELEQSINQLKMELSATSFLDVSGSNITPFGDNNFTQKQQQDYHEQPQIIVGGPTLDRMQSLNRRRQLLQNNSLHSFNRFYEGNISIDQPLNQGSTTDNIDHDNNTSNRSQLLKLEEGFETPVMRTNKKLLPQRNTTTTPTSMIGLSPVPFEQVFSHDTMDAKRKEMISNLSNLDLS